MANFIITLLTRSRILRRRKNYQLVTKNKKFTPEWLLLFKFQQKVQYYLSLFV